MKFDLKAAREKQRYTQDALAKILHLPKRTLQDWERKGAPHPHILSLALDHIAGKRFVLEEAPKAPRPKLTPQERADCAAGYMTIGFTRADDGTWMTMDEVRQLPEGATWWQTGQRGAWQEMRRTDSAERLRPGVPTGRTDRWRPWRYWTDEEPDDSV